VLTRFCPEWEEHLADESFFLFYSLLIIECAMMTSTVQSMKVLTGLKLLTMKTSGELL